MKTEKETTKEKILYETLFFIEREGVHAVTVRKIAECAKVNVAAINYHFGSKEQLLEEALEFSLYNAFKDPLIEVKEKDLTTNQAVRFLLHDWFEGLIKYPGISKAQLFKPFISNNYDSLFVKKLNEFLSNFIEQIAKKDSQINQKEFKTALVQMISAIILPGIMPELFSNFLEIDFKDKEKREEYFSYLLNKYLN